MKSSRRHFLKIGSLALGFAAFVGAGWRGFAKSLTPKAPWAGVVNDTIITCHSCNFKVQEKMASEAAKLIYHCPKCLTWLSPRQGDHCIYDSYGSVKCPTMQIKERRAKNLPI